MKAPILGMSDDQALKSSISIVLTDVNELQGVTQLKQRRGLGVLCLSCRGRNVEA